MESILRLKEVSKAYKKSDFRLEQISFSVPYGSIVGFVGENGAGKSTTIGCVLNTISRDSGSIEVFGREMQEQDVEIKQRIGVVYDGENFPGNYSAGQLSDIFRGIYEKWDDALFQFYLKEFGLSKGQKIKTYSKGMTMKLAIAAALSHHPDLLILDEATSGLDPSMRDEMLDIFLDFVGTEKRSILFSTHITSDLEKIADYIVLIHKGKILLTEEKDKIVYHYGVMRCGKGQFNAMEENDKIAWRRRDYQIDVLVSDREKILKKYPGTVVDHVSIDELVVLLTKGEKR